MDQAMITSRGVWGNLARADGGERSRRWLALVLLGVIGGAACGESTGEVVDPPLPGSIVLTTETSGFLKDDSYELLVNGESRGTIGANDEITLSELDPATYEVTLSDVADNCVVGGASASASASVPVIEEEAVTVALTVVCAHAAPSSYTVRFNRERPDLDTGAITECPFSICPTEEEWDLYVYFSSQSDPHSVIRQNQTTAVEIAHVAAVVLADLTEADYVAATFGTALVADPFDAGRVILIRTDLGNVYALGNPVEDESAQTLTFDAALIAVPVP